MKILQGKKQNYSTKEIKQMIEKVNPEHPDKIADRIAGAIVDLVYERKENPRIAVEVLIGHGECKIIIEANIGLHSGKIKETVKRITKDKNINIDILQVSQDEHLQMNQEEKKRCGDNGIFRGIPLTEEEKEISRIAKDIYREYPTDGKYILDKGKLTVCQSHCNHKFEANNFGKDIKEVLTNPLGYWTGGPHVHTGATNRKLGSDMATSVTGGGLHGKDLSKADVTLNIYAFNKAQETGEIVEISCSIGDEEIDGKPYEELVEEARQYINNLGGFEKFAEWGLF